MLRLPACHFVSHLLQHVSMTALIFLGFLIHVIQPAPVPILQQRFKSLFTHFQSVIPFPDLSLSPLPFLVHHFSSLLPHTQVHVSFASPSLLYWNVCAPKGGESGRDRYPISHSETPNYRRCEKLSTVQWGQDWCCLAFKTEAVSAQAI